MRISSVLVAACDLLCFVAFALIGLRSHDEGLGAGSVARVAGPFALSWAASSWLTGLYRTKPDSRSATAALVFRTWLPAWAGGLAVRAVFFGRSPFTAFAVIALLFNGILLLAWRFAAGAFGQRRRSPAAADEVAPVLTPTPLPSRRADAGRRFPSP